MLDCSTCSQLQSWVQQLQPPRPHHLLQSIAPQACMCSAWCQVELGPQQHSTVSSRVSLLSPQARRCFHGAPFVLARDPDTVVAANLDYLASLGVSQADFAHMLGR